MQKYLVFTQLSKHIAENYIKYPQYINEIAYFWIFSTFMKTLFQESLTS